MSIVDHNLTNLVQNMQVTLIQHVCIWSYPPPLYTEAKIAAVAFTCEMEQSQLLYSESPMHLYIIYTLQIESFW